MNLHQSLSYMIADYQRQRENIERSQMRKTAYIGLSLGFSSEVMQAKESQVKYCKWWKKKATHLKQYIHQNYPLKVKKEMKTFSDKN